MGSRRSKVLIVDDEDNIVLALHRVLYQDNHRYDVLLARTAEIAQQILLDIPVDVLVTDVHLPEKSGMDLLCWAAVETPTTRVIVMTAFDVTGIKDRAHAFGCLRLMRKPFDVHEMRATILKALDRRDSFTGNLSELSAIDVIQMLCIARKTTSLRLSEDKSSGVILIENGEIVHAIWDRLVGEDAFFAMMSVKNGLFYTSQLPPDIERTIKGDWQYLLIEGLRRLDEAAAGILPDDEPNQSVRFSAVEHSTNQNTASTPPAQGASAAPPPPPPPPPPAPNVPEPPSAPQRNNEVSRLIDQGFAALRSGQRDDARKYWEEALKLEPTNRMIELNLRKLEAKNLRDQR
jgi:DNA-binding NarL/FixJ family response regulator